MLNPETETPPELCAGPGKEKPGRSRADFAKPAPAEALLRRGLVGGRLSGIGRLRLCGRLALDDACELGSDILREVAADAPMPDVGLLQQLLGDARTVGQQLLARVAVAEL